MAELIEENEPTPLRKFLLNVQWGIRYIIRATPLLCAQKRTYSYGSCCQLMKFCYRKRQLKALGISLHKDKFEQSNVVLSLQAIFNICRLSLPPRLIPLLASPHNSCSFVSVSTALSILSHWTSQLLNCTWSSLRMSLTSQLFACWRHLIGMYTMPPFSTMQKLLYLYQLTDCSVCKYVTLLSKIYITETYWSIIVGSFLLYKLEKQSLNEAIRRNCIIVRGFFPRYVVYLCFGNDIQRKLQSDAEGQTLVY